MGERVRQAEGKRNREAAKKGRSKKVTRYRDKSREGAFHSQPWIHSGDNKGRYPPQAYPGRLYTSDRATALLGCRVFRSSLKRRSEQFSQYRTSLVVGRCGVMPGPTLMNSQVTPIAEDDGVARLALSVVAHRTEAVLCRQAANRPRYVFLELKPELLQFVYEDLEEFARYGICTFCCSL